MSKRMKQMNEVLTTKLIEYINNATGIDIRSRCRDFNHTMARSIYFKVAQEQINITLKEVAGAVNRHHATAIHARSLFDEVISYDQYKGIYENALDYIKFVKESLIRENNVNSNNTEALAEQIVRLNDIISKQREIILNQQHVIDAIGLEDHELKYRELPDQKQYIFKERVNAMLKMI